MATKTAKKVTFKDQLSKLGACEEARDWCGDRTAQQAWDECENPNWMFWLLAETMPEKTTIAVRRKIVRIACDTARPALKHVPNGEDRPRQAIDLAEKWAKGGAVTVEELAAASDAARAASDAARAARAARDAARAARAASDAARAARAARDAARAARAAARAAWAASDAARAAQCKLIRKYFAKCPTIN